MIEITIGMERWKCSNISNGVFETDAIIILVQHKLKNGPIRKMTRAGEVQASEE